MFVLSISIDLKFLIKWILVQNTANIIHLLNEYKNGSGKKTLNVGTTNQVLTMQSTKYHQLSSMNWIFTWKTKPNSNYAIFDCLRMYVYRWYFQVF